MFAVPRIAVSVAIAALLSIPASPAFSQHRIETFAGGGPDEMAAIAAAIGNPTAVAVDAAGTVYIASYSHRVFKVDGGHLTVLAGTGIGGFGGDGGPARDAMLNTPTGVAVDAAGNVYVCDWVNARIRRIDAVTLEISTVAGGGSDPGDSGPALDAALAGPNGVAVDASGAIYIAETGANRIRKVSGGTIATVAAGSLNFPLGVAVDGAGNLFIADASNGRVQRVDASSGAITTAATLAFPSGVAVSGADLFISEHSGSRVWRASSGVMTPYAGTGVVGFSGDTGPAAAATLSGRLLGIAAGPAGDVYIADSFNLRVRRVDATSLDVDTVAGNGTPALSGDGGPARRASLTVTGVAVDAAGNVFFPDQVHPGLPDTGRIRVIDAATGDIGTVAGSVGIAREGFGLTPDGLGGWYVADFAGNRVRRVDAAGVISTVAGTGAAGFFGEGTPADQAVLNGPTAVARDAVGNLYIADTNNHRVRKVDILLGSITTVAGSGLTGLGTPPTPPGDGPDARAARVWNPTGLAFDAAGNLYIAEQYGHRVRKVDASGAITTVAGGGTGGDGGPAANAALSRPTGLTFDAIGNLYVTETEVNTSRVRRIDTAGIITTFAGTGAAGYTGDGGPATAATLGFLSPWGVAVDGRGNVVLGDRFNNRIRRVLNEAPFAEAGPDQAATADTAFTLSATGSGDPDSDTITFTWTDDTGTVVGTTANLTLIRPAGVFTFTLTVSDGFLSDSDDVTVTLEPMLIVNIFGAGAGTVSSMDGGILCSSGIGGDCAETYPAGAPVTLTAFAAPGSVFAGWGGACASSTTSQCVMAMTSSALVSAAFNVQTFTLSVSSTPGGVVTSDTGGISCGTSCSATFVTGSSVTLTATPDVGYRFDGWTGDCLGTGICTLDMIGDRSAGAVFSAIALTGLASAPASASIGVGQMLQITATGTFSDGSSRIVGPVSALELGDQFSCVLLANGTVKCWGGIGGILSPTPQIVPALSGVMSLGAGTSQACAVLPNGTVKCWGNGYLGDGATTISPTPVTVSGITTATAVVVGASFSHACALLSDGSVQCWGAGGRLGDGTMNPSPTPVAVNGITNAVAISSEGGIHTCALLADGTIRCWGGDGLGQLGDGGTLPGGESLAPVTVSGIADATAVAAGSSHTCALVGTGAVKCWGGNSFGELGNGGGSDEPAPVDVTGITSATAIAAGDFHHCALLDSGGVRCWGAAMANGSPSHSALPIAIAGITNAAAIATGDLHSCATLFTGGVRCWGAGLGGQLGDGNHAASAAPVSVIGISTAQFVAWAGINPTVSVNASGRVVGVATGGGNVVVSAGGMSAVTAVIVHNTGAGSAISVSPVDPSTGAAPATLTFDDVTQAGDTRLTLSPSGLPPPSGFQLGSPPVYFELTTTALFTGSIEICIHYTGIAFAGPPALFHFEGGAWVDRTTSVDAVNEIVCGTVTSLSPFALFEPVTPAVTVNASPRELWPPNHRLVPVTLSVKSGGVPMPASSCAIAGVASSEPVNGLGDGDTAPDWMTAAGLALRLRAERSGQGPGRVYTITVRCTVAGGGTSTARTEVRVPHSRR